MRPYHPPPFSSSFHQNPSTTAASTSRKRQRRQAAAAFLFPTSQAVMGRKSTAQPRPVVHVAPRGIGPIVEPNPNDVLCGRGGRINSHPGNIQFRDMVNARKKEYLAKSTKKLEKAHIAARIVEEIRSMDPPGRFLKEDGESGLWWDIGDLKAIKKSGQALREDAPDIRSELGGGGDDDDSDTGKNESEATPDKKTVKVVEHSKSTEATPETKQVLQPHDEEVKVVSKDLKDSRLSPAPTPKLDPKTAPSPPTLPPPTTTSRTPIATAITTTTTTSNVHCPPPSVTKEPMPQPPVLPTPPPVEDPQAGGMLPPAPHIPGVGIAFPAGLLPSQNFVTFPAQQYIILPFPTPAAQPSAGTAVNPGTATPTMTNARAHQAMYSFPAQLYQGVKSFGNKASFSEKASEAMRSSQPQHQHQHQHQHHNPYNPNNDPNVAMMMMMTPNMQEAFGRPFHPPTELSTGSTMSTISGISGLSSVMDTGGSLLSSGLASHRSFGGMGMSMGANPVTAMAMGHGMDYSDARLNSLRMSQLSNPMQTMEARRTSQVSSDLRESGGSDLTFSMRSLGSLSRSLSFPELSSTIREEMRLNEGSDVMNKNHAQAVATAPNNNMQSTSNNAMMVDPNASLTMRANEAVAASALSSMFQSPATSENSGSSGIKNSNLEMIGSSASPSTRRVVMHADSGTSGGSGSGRPVYNRNRSTSTASSGAMSLSVASMSIASTGESSEGSSTLWNAHPLPAANGNVVDGMISNSTTSAATTINNNTLHQAAVAAAAAAAAADDSSRSMVSDLSNDIGALDLAGTAEQKRHRRLKQKQQQQHS